MLGNGPKSSYLLIPLNYTLSTNNSMIENLLGNKLAFHSVSLSGVERSRETGLAIPGFALKAEA